MKYHLAALGGTFDRIHIGHKEVIKTALSHAEKCIIGVTQSSLIQDKTLSHLIEPYDDRVNNVKQILQELNATDRATIVPLTDAYGPTLSDPTIDLLVVSTQTKPGGEIINQARIDHKLPPLSIMETPMIPDDSGEHISSTQIRLGKTTRSGKNYQHLFEKTITFSKDTLALLSQMQGELITSQISPTFLHQFTQVGVVGDVVTNFFLTHQLSLNIALVDGHTERNIPFTISDNAIWLTKQNQPGGINHEIAQQIIQYLNTTVPTVLVINGEEDLLVFVLCLMFPLGSAVFYGQPGKGIVMIRITESVKLRLAQLIDPSFK